MIGRVLRTGTSTVSRALHAVGWTPRVRSVGDLRVVLYHGIGDGAHPAMRHLADEIPRQVFEQQLDYLAHHYEIVRLEDGLAAPAGARPRCAITFDDGLRSIATDAAPILKRRGLPAAIFLNTAVVGTTDRLWQHRLSTVIERDGVAAVAARAGIQAATGLDIIDHVQHQFADCRALLSWLETQDVGSDRLYLNWDEVSTLTADGFDFYSHTARHLPLAHVEPEVMRAEIDHAQAYAGANQALVSFPFGMESDFGRDARTYALTRHAFVVEVEDGWNPPQRVQATRTVRRVCLAAAVMPTDLYASLELLPLAKGTIKRLVS